MRLAIHRVSLYKRHMGIMLRFKVFEPTISTLVCFGSSFPKTQYCVIGKAFLRVPLVFYLQENSIFYVVMITQDRNLSENIADLLLCRVNSICNIFYVLSRNNSAPLANEFIFSNIKAAHFHVYIEHHRDWIFGNSRVC